MVGKRIAALLFIVICAIILLFCYFQWKDKLAGVAGDQGTAIEEALSGAVNKAGETAESADEVNLSRTAVSLTAEDIVRLTANMGDDVAALLKNRYDEGEPVRLLIVGSQAISQGAEGGAAGLIASFLEETYGDFMETEIVALAGTSKEFVDTMEELVEWDAGYDLLLLEPFTLNNNGKVVIEDEHRDILAVRDQLRAYQEDAELIVMPPQPIHRPNFYSTQIRSLGKFTETKGIPYIDHWEQWPDPSSEMILGYLEEDSAPNELGASTWAGAVEQYFGKSE